MDFWTYQNLEKITGGTWRSAPADLDAVLPAAAQDTGAILCHDTRELSAGQCYLAIKGENFDGHTFTDQAFERGASLAIVDADSPPSAIAHQPSPILEVPDTVKALQELARAYRDVLAAGTTSEGGCKVIGVAGSNGKTTTRHLIHHVLTHAGRRGTQSPKSFNNHLGVPLTLLAARPEDDFVACEIGTNHPGEIDFLSAIARPDIAVITSIGEEHLEFFGDVEGVADEEYSIFEYIQETGHLVIHNECLYFHAQRKYPDATFRAGGQAVIAVTQRGHTRLPESDLYYSFPPRKNKPKRPYDGLGYDILIHFSDKQYLTRFNLPGQFNLNNACVALGVAVQMGVSCGNAAESLRTFTPSSMRGEVHKFGSQVTLINDAYNANPSSMTAALSMLAWLPTEGRRVAIVGDMFELGDQSKHLHRKVAMELDWDFQEFGPFELIVLLGTDAQVMREVFSEGIHVKATNIASFPDNENIPPEKITALLQPGDTVLLKASRGMRLERLIPAIEARFGKAQDTHS